MLSVVLAITWLHNFEPNDKELLKYVTIIVIGNAFQAFDVIDAYFQSQILSRNSVVAKTFAFIIVCIVKVVLILNNCSLLYFTVAVLLEIILSSLFIVFSYRYCRHHILKWKFSLLEAKSLMKFAWPLMSGILFVNIYMRIDQIMIGSFIDKSALGVYSVAVSLSQIWYFFPMAIVRSIFPLIVSLRSNNYALYHAHLLRLYSVMFWLGVAAGLFFTLLGNYIITTLYGSAFTGAYSVLVINIWGGIFVSQSLARGNWLISENYQNYRLIVQIFLAAFNVILNVILIPKYGLRGAALASVLSQAVCIWGITLLIRPLRNSTISMLKAINPIFLFRVPSGEKA